MIVAFAALGALTAAIAFPRPTTQEIELVPAPPNVSIVPEPVGLTGPLDGGTTAKE